jgi:hypothetical protein
VKSFDPTVHSSRERKVAGRIAGSTFIYRRVGHDHRLLTFLENGSIGRGAAGRESHWNVNERSGRVALEILSVAGLTCRLFEGADKVWRGRWRVCERMAIELLPLTDCESAGSWRMGTRSALQLWPPSLFVVSLPRSLSTLVYHRSCLALGLSKPLWTYDGEILNLDRFKLLPGPMDDLSRKFITRSSEPGLFHAAEQFLNEVASPFGYGYKDVVQPFVVAEWLKQTRTRAIRIRRNLADVAYSMLAQNWHYPARLFPKTRDRRFALVQGLVKADQALDSVPAEQIDFDELTVDERPLNRALQTLYGKRKAKRIEFIDDEFNEIRSQVLDRRRTREYKRLADLVAKALEWSKM